MSDQGARSTLQRIAASLRRDAGLGLAATIEKGARFVASAATAPWHLRRCNEVGNSPRTFGAPLVKNLGRIRIGDRVIIASQVVVTELATGRRAALDIGDDVAINFGSKIEARAAITIGDRVSVGTYVNIIDHDGEEDDAPAPIRVGDDVWIAMRVTVKKGVTIGDGAVITAGSVVESDVPPNAIAGGVPARVIGWKRGFAPRVIDEPVARTIEAAPEVAVEPDARGVLISDFSVQELVDQLHVPDELGTTLEADVAPFGQVVQTLHGLAAASEPPDFAFVWTRPESITSFAALLDGQAPSFDEIDREVRAFADLLVRSAKSTRFLFVASWTLPPHHRGLGMRDLKKGGVAATLMRMNLALADALEGAADVHLLDAAKWITHVGAGAVSAKLWYLGKVGFANEVFAEAARDLKAAVRGVRGRAKKLVVLDLDDTLWGGIVGDVGWQNLRLGGHDGLGEAFVDFQRELKALSRRGVALAIVSKNEESVALEAIASHPEMILKREDIVAHRINWIDKAKNVAEIAAELNLGLQSVVFIDDNPVERARVREALPEVLVPEWPKDPMQYTSAFLSLRCFDAPVVSKEDTERTAQYVAEKKREALKTDVGSLDAWLESLGIHVAFAELGPSNVARTTQLLNKTNQMNLSTRRLGEVELTAWANEPGRELWTITVGDKFGDAGLTGILGLAFEGDRAIIVDYVLSCRVMGRKVEETLLAFAVMRARAKGAREVIATFIATPKNKPCFSFLKSSGFGYDDAASTFRFDLDSTYAFPRGIAVEGASLDESARSHHAGGTHAA